MNKPEFITFTGVDDRTDLKRIEELSIHYPVEWGVLFSSTRAGREPRYPELTFQHRLEELNAMRFSAHICGGYAKNVLKGLTREVPVLWDIFSRFQVNYIPNPEWHPYLEQPNEFVPIGIPEILQFSFKVGVEPIVQHRTLHFPPPGPMSYLFDKSGGKGEGPKQWPKRNFKFADLGERGNLVGYAGGLGPDNVLEALEQIADPGRYWIDMESNVRTDDWLDLDKCQAVLGMVYDS